MRVPRETIYAGLFTFLQKAPGLTYSSRRFVPFAQLQGKSPALFQLEKDEAQGSRPDPRMNPAWEIMVTVVVYVAATQDPTFVPYTPLNNILDYIEAAIPPSGPVTAGFPYGTGQVRQNLGIPGVQAVYIDGPIEKDEGIIAPDSYAAVPIKIIVA